MAEGASGARSGKLTRVEVARRLGVGRSTVRRLEARGELAPTRGPDGVWRFDVADVEELEARWPGQAGPTSSQESGRPTLAVGALSAGHVAGEQEVSGQAPDGQVAEAGAAGCAASPDRGMSDCRAELERQLASLTTRLEAALTRLASQDRQLAEQRTLLRLTAEGLGNRVVMLERAVTGSRRTGDGRSAES